MYVFIFYKTLKILPMNRSKIPLLILGIIIPFIIFSCDKDQNEIDYLKFKEIAWNSLSPATQDIVLHDWQDAEASLTKNPDNNKDVIVVIFHTPYDALTCAIAVYIDLESEEVIYPENVPRCM